jgi:hypothetical protein
MCRVSKGETLGGTWRREETLGLEKMAFMLM